MHELTEPIVATIAATGHSITDLWIFKTFLLLMTLVIKKIQDTLYNMSIIEYLN